MKHSNVRDVIASYGIENCLVAIKSPGKKKGLKRVSDSCQVLKKKKKKKKERVTTGKKEGGGEKRKERKYYLT